MSSDMELTRALIITGSVGVGKSTTADAMAEILSKKQVPHAVIDMDYLRYAWPHPKNDPFNQALGIKNLTSLWVNYQEIGIKKLLIPTVIETRADIDAIAQALPGAKVAIVRLKGRIDTVHTRLHERHSKRDEANLAWHLDRAVELTEQLEKSGIEDFGVDTDNKSVKEVAKEVLAKWQEAQNG